MPINYKDINELTEETNIAGTEKVPVSSTKYVLFNKIKDWIINSLKTTGLDLGGNKIKNAGFEVVTSLPTANNFVGRQVTYQGRSYIWNGSAWKCDADTLGGKPYTDFYGVFESSIKPITNQQRTNLGNPSVFETAIINSQFTNKVWFFPISNTTFERSTDDITYNIASDITDAQKRNLFSGAGNANANIRITKGQYLRITLDATSYVILNMLYLWYTNQGDTSYIKIEKYSLDTASWSNIIDYQSFGGRPAHTVVRHTNLYFANYNTTTHFSRVRITIKVNTDTSGGAHTDHILSNIEWWGSYPAGLRTIYYNDGYKNVYFPASVQSNQTINFDTNNIEPTQTGTVTKTSTWTWQYLTQSMNYSWLKLKTWVGGLFSAGSATTNNNYLPKIDDVNKKLVKSNIYDNGTNVGIGTTTLSEKLQVDGNVKANGYKVGSGTDTKLLTDGGGTKLITDFAQLENGKIKATNLPDYLLGQVLYGGSINSSQVCTFSSLYKDKFNTTDTTRLLSTLTASSHVGVYFIASGNFLLFGAIDIKVGDWVISDGNTWGKIDNTDAVASVNGLTGVINLTYGDLGAMPPATNTKVGGVKLGTVTEGLDADLLDGKHASDFATSTHTHSDLHSHDNKPNLDAVEGTNTGDETTQRIGTLIKNATAKTTPVNADMVGLMDSTASNVIKRLSWANIKATLKTYFDTLYAKLSFASIKVGAENVDASRDSMVEFIAGTNVSLTANNTAKTITIAASETIQVLSSGGEILNYLTDGIYRLNLNHLTGNYPDSVCGTKPTLVQPIGTEILRQYTGNNGNHDIKTQIMLIQNETYRRSGLGNYWNEWERLITCKDMANYATIDMLGTFDGEYLEPDVPVNVYRDTTYTIDGEAKEGKYVINLGPLFINPPLEIIEIYIAISPQNQADYTLEIQLSDYAIDTRESSSSTTAHFGDYASITIPQGTSFVLLKIYMWENVSRCYIVYTFG